MAVSVLDFNIERVAIIEDSPVGVTGAVYCQTLPFVEPRVFAVYADFERALYASLGTEPKERRFVREEETIASRNPS